MFVNHHSRQVTAKIVYYGPGLSGKTTNLQYIFSVTNPKTRGELISIQTDVERTLFFDLLPINVGLVNGYQAKFQLYTVPGQVFYDSTRQLVLKGADGIVFVVDSQEMMEKANLDSFENLKANLAKYSQSIEGISLVFQYNKRDLKNVLPIDRLNSKLNSMDAPYYGAAAIIGTGVIETLREISSMTLRKIKGLLDQGIQSQTTKAFVNFDTDQRHKIIKRHELPFKKVIGKSVEDFEKKSHLNNFDTIEAPAIHGLPTAQAAPPDDPEAFDIEELDNPFEDDMEDAENIENIENAEVPPNESEEVLELTEFEEMEEKPPPPPSPSSPPPPPVLERTDEIPELKGFDDEEIQIELGELTGYDMEPAKTDTEKLPFPGKPEKNKEFEKTEEIEKPPAVKPAKPAKEMEKTAMEMDVNKVELLKKIPPKPKTGEIAAVPGTNKPGINKLAAQPQPNQFEVKPQSPPFQPKPQPGEFPAKPKATEPKPHELVPKPKPQPNGLDANKAKPNEFEFLEKLRDDSRLTFIRKMILLPGPDDPMVIEVRDKGDNSLLLEPLEIKITPGVKKITVILDIK